MATRAQQAEGRAVRAAERAENNAAGPTTVKALLNDYRANLGSKSTKATNKKFQQAVRDARKAGTVVSDRLPRKKQKGGMQGGSKFAKSVVAAAKAGRSAQVAAPKVAASTGGGGGSAG